MSPRHAFQKLEDSALEVLGRLAAPVHIYSFGQQSICWANRPAEALWSASGPDELSSREVSPQSTAVRLRLEEYREAFARGEERTESWTLYPKGKATTVLCHCRGVSIEGHPEAMLVEVVPFADATLPDAEVRAIEALRHTPLMISLFDGKGNVLMRNPAATAAFGSIDTATPGADHFAEMFLEKDAPARLLNAVRAGGHAMEICRTTAPGHPSHSLQINRLADPATGEEVILVSQQDVTETLEARQHQAESEDALDLVLSLNVAPLLILSETTETLLRCNRSAQDMLGISDVGSLASDRRYWDREALAALHKRLEQEEFASGEVELRRADGETLWVFLAGVRIHYRGQPALIFTATDIDKLHRANRELEAALGVERRVGDLNRQILAIASHELRTPLAIIDSAAQRIESNAERSANAFVVNAAQRIRKSVQVLVRVMDSTLSRVEQALPLQQAPLVETDLAALIEYCAQSVRDINPEARIRVSLPSLPKVRLDGSLVEGLFFNLLANSIKYSNGPANIEITGAIEDDKISVVVRDEGIGIPEADRPAVFEKFARASNVGNRPGSGLGLALVREAMERHAGTINLLPDDGTGLALNLQFPLVRELS